MTVADYSTDVQVYCVRVTTIVMSLSYQVIWETRKLWYQPLHIMMFMQCASKLFLHSAIFHAGGS